MVLAIVVGVVIGGLATVGLRGHAARVEERHARSRERLAAIVLYEEVKAAIDAIDLALQDDSSRWFESMSESPTLTEAWCEQAELLIGLGAERWDVLSDAVSAGAPRHGLSSVSPQAEDLRRTLIERRELLVESAGILRVLRDRQPRKRAPHSRRLPALLV